MSLSYFVFFRKLPNGLFSEKLTMNNIETRQPNFDKKFTNNGISNNEFHLSTHQHSFSCDLANCAEGSTEENLNTENIPTSSTTLQSTSSALIVPTSSTILCRYFQSGQCRYGALCRFSHNLESAYPTVEQTVTSSQAADTIHSSDTITEFSEEKSNGEEIVHENHNSEKIVPSDPASWINAPVFVPKHLSSTSETVFSSTPSSEAVTDSQAKSYAQIVSGDENLHSTYEYAASMLCPYVKGIPVVTENNEESYICPYGVQCMYQHALLCDMCGNYCLHPTDEQQRKQHRNVSIESNIFLGLIITLDCGRLGLRPKINQC